jgi:transcriptional regulator GlxA family with amidase domain
MIKLGILLTRQYRLLSVAAILDVFETVNTFAKGNGQEPYFDISLLRADASQVQASDAMINDQIHHIDEVDKQDLILIPAFSTFELQLAVEQNYAYIPWLQHQFAQGTHIASFCTGAFLLGATGLLNGRAATTHIDACGAFSASFPDVNLLPYQVVTSDGGIYTSGGSTSSFHLMLHLIKQYCGAELTIRTAKIFSIDMDRSQQAYFGTFAPPQDHHDQLVAMAQQKIEASYRDSGTIEEMIKDVPSSRRNMVRRFKQVTGCTPIEYLQKLRVEGAKKLLEQTNQQMTEIMLNSGYNDPKAFRKIFKKTVGMTPTGYREKFQVN